MSDNTIEAIWRLAICLILTVNGLYTCHLHDRIKKLEEKVK